MNSKVSPASAGADCSKKLSLLVSVREALIDFGCELEFMDDLDDLINETSASESPNIASIVRIMDMGPMHQAFVIDAVGKLARGVAASKPEDYSRNCGVHPETWIAVGKQIQGELTNHLKVS